MFLKYENNWHHHVYKIGTHRIEKLAWVKIDETLYSVFYETDSNCERGYAADSKRYYIKVKIHGTYIPQYLDVLLKEGLKIKVDRKTK